MFTALDTEGQISLQRSSDWLRRSERINRVLCFQPAQPRTAVRRFITTAARTVVDACPVLRVAFPSSAPIGYATNHQ